MGVKKRVKRRDRRKAKASGWARRPKVHQHGVSAHGSSQGFSRTGQLSFQETVNAIFRKAGVSVEEPPIPVQVKTKRKPTAESSSVDPPVEPELEPADYARLFPRIFGLA